MAGNGQNEHDSHEVEHRLIELQYVLQQYENQYNYISDELSSAQSTLKGIEAAQSAAQKAMQGSFSGRNLLINIGGGLFASAKANDLNALLISIGAGILVEVPPGTAYALLGKRRGIAEQNVSKLSEERKRIEHEIYNISFMIQQLTNGQNV